MGFCFYSYTGDNDTIMPFTGAGYEDGRANTSVKYTPWSQQGESALVLFILLSVAKQCALFYINDKCTVVNEFITGFSFHRINQIESVTDVYRFEPYESTEIIVWSISPGIKKPGHGYDNIYL